MDMIFIRHGVTILNEQQRYGGITDAVLSEKGIRDMERYAEYYKDIPFGSVYVSPLKRAVQTAEMITGTYHLDERLREMDFGIFEGLTYHEISTRFPVESEQWQQDFVHYRIPHGESLADVFERTKSFIKDLGQAQDRVLVVTHAGIIRCALSMAFGNPTFFYKFHIHHSTASVINIQQEYWYVKGINCTAGLKEILG